MRRLGAALAAAAVGLALTIAPTASASASLRVGIFDDGVVLYGEPDLVFPQLAKTGTSLRVHLPPPRRQRSDRDRRAARLRLPPRRAGEPDRLHEAPAALAEDGLVRHASRARSRQVETGAIPARVDQRGLRRPGRPSTARDVLGERQPHRSAWGLRRGEALRRGADDGLPPAAGRRHRDRADLQHVRAPHAAERRPGDPELPRPGPRREAADGLRRRLADPVASVTSTT